MAGIEIAANFRGWTNPPRPSNAILQVVTSGGESDLGWKRAQNGSTLHSADWRRRHWERSGILDVEIADFLTDGWQFWRDLLKLVAPENEKEWAPAWKEIGPIFNLPDSSPKGTAIGASKLADSSLRQLRR